VGFDRFVCGLFAIMWVHLHLLWVLTLFICIDCGLKIALFAGRSADVCRSLHLGNPIEQSHREIKQRYYPTLGFDAFESAKRFCQANDEIRQFLRPRVKMAEFVSLSERRERFLTRVDKLQEVFQAA